LEKKLNLLSQKSSLPKRLTVAVILLPAVIVAVLLFIWGNSLESQPESQARSLGIVALIKPLLEPIVGTGNVTDHLVRKIAHFLEFAVLGTLLVLYTVVRGRFMLQSAVNCLSFSLAAAVTDESLQLFSSRGSQVQDVLLDFAGAAAGVGFMLLIYSVVTAIRRKLPSK
jgi:VanZ family protein